MAIPVPAAKASVFSTSAATSYATTGTYTPGAQSLLVACVVNSLASTPLDPTTFTGHGVTWTKLTLGTRLIGTTHCMSVWVANAGAAPSSAAATAGFGAVSQTGCAIIEYEITGADLSGTAVAAIVQNPTGNSTTGTTGTVTYAARGNPGNAQLSFFAHLANEATTPKAGWTESASDGNYATPSTGVEGQFRDDGTFDTSSTATWSTSSNWLAVGLEVKTRVSPGNGAVGLTGLAATLALALGLTAGSLTVSSPYLGVAFGGLNVGQVTVSGQAPTVTISSGGATTIPIGAGSIALTGNTHTLQFQIATGAGSLNVAGLAPIERLVLPVPVGSIALTGGSPALALTVPLGVGALNVTGQAPHLAGVTATPAGSLSVAGLALTPSITSPIPLQAGSIALTGQSPVLASVVAVPAGSLDLTGLAPNTLNGVQRAPGAGSLGLSGNTPTLSTVVGCPAGSLALTGQHPSLAFVSVLPVGSLSLSGLAPHVLSDQPVPCPAGSITLSGWAPAATVGVIGLPPAGTMTFTGAAASLQFSVLVRPAAGSLDLTGRGVAVLSVVAVPAGSHNLTGQAPTLIVQAPGATTIPIGAGSIAISGSAPTLQFVPIVPVASVAVSGIAPACGLGVASSQGAIGLTSNPPACLFAVNLVAGSCTLQGRSPTLASALSVPAGTLLLTGRSAALSIQQLPITLSPSSASIGLSGSAPTLTAALERHGITLDTGTAIWQPILPIGIARHQTAPLSIARAHSVLPISIAQWGD